MGLHIAKPSGRHYRYQRKVPEDIRWAWKGRLLVKSLKTNNKREASRLANAIDEQIERVFTDCRMKLVNVTEARNKIAAIVSDDEGTGETTLKDVAKAYERHHGENWNPKGSQEFWSAIDSCIAVIGDRILRHIDDGLMTKVRDTMRLDGAGQRTVNKKLSRVSAVFNYARKKKLMPYNPIPDVMYSVSKNQKKKAAYHPYEDADVKLIFETLLEHPGRSRWCSYMYWLPILAAFTGGRLGDLCDLAKNDLKKRSDIYILEINNNKTGDIKRPVPVHSRLIELGFVTWVESLADGEKLFSVTQRPDNGEYDYKWYGKAIRPHIEDPQKVFHSWRKTLSNKLNNAGVPATHRADVIGHERRTDTETDESYTTDTDILVLKEALERVDYDVDWSKVKIKQTT